MRTGTALAEGFFWMAEELRYGYETTAPDPQRALKLYRQSAELGFPRAYLRVGEIYERGVGVPANAVEAFTQYRRAAEQGEITGYAAMARLVGRSTHHQKAASIWRRYFEAIVAKLWSLCHVLRDDGITYNEYVTELTYLLFLKMLAETERENRLPAEYRWDNLARREGLEQLDYYKRMLLDLGDPKKVSDALVRSIFVDAQTRLRKPTNLKALTTSIDKLDWFSAREEGLGTSTRASLKRTLRKRSRVPGNISRLDPSSTASSAY